jgi:hypothetical protein
MAAIALFIGFPSAWFTYDSWRITRQQTSKATPAPSPTTGPANTEGFKSPANTGNGNTFIYGNTPQQDKK